MTAIGVVIFTGAHVQFIDTSAGTVPALYLGNSEVHMRRTITMTDFFIVLMVLFVSLFYFMTRMKTNVRTGMAFEQDYSMPRVSKENRRYLDLSGREIDRQNIYPFAKKPAVTVAHGRGDGVKAADPKKADKKKATAKKSNATKKKKFDVNVVDADQTAMSPSDVSASGGYSVTIKNKLAADKKAQQELGIDPVIKGSQYSADQWQGLLLGAGSYKEMAQLARDFNDKKIDADTFYAIIEELLKNQSEEKNAMAVYGLTATPSYKSFKYLAMISGQYTEKVEQQIQVAIQAYTSFSRFGILNAALADEEEVVVFKSVTTIELAARQWVEMDEQQQAKRRIASSDAARYFEALKPQLQKLTESANAELVQASQAALKQIELLSN